MKLYTIIPMYNVENWIGRNLAMLKEQVYSDFCCILTDDTSTDGTLQAARDEIAGDSRFELIENKTRKFALRNIYESIARLNPKDEDILVIIDGDDSLFDSKSLARIVDTYESKDCLLTYGSHADKHGKRDEMCKEYPEHVLTRRRVRNYHWRGAHPRTFKYKLWRQIKNDSFGASQSELDAAKRRALLKGQFRTWSYWNRIALKEIHDESGKFFRRCYDKAIMFPMLEMAGNRAQFIENFVYWYNNSSLPLPYDNKKVPKPKWLTRCIRSIVKAKPRYQPIS